MTLRSRPSREWPCLPLHVRPALSDRDASWPLPSPPTSASPPQPCLALGPALPAKLLVLGRSLLAPTGLAFPAFLLHAVAPPRILGGCYLGGQSCSEGKAGMRPSVCISWWVPTSAPRSASASAWCSAPRPAHLLGAAASSPLCASPAEASFLRTGTPDAHAALRWGWALLPDFPNVSALAPWA